MAALPSGPISACTDQLDAPIDESFMGATSLPPSVKKKPSKPPSHHGQVIKPIPPTKPVAPLPRTPRPKVPAEVMPRVPAVMESAEGLPTLSQHAPRAQAEPMLIPEAQDTDRPRGTAPLRPVLVIFSAVAKRLAFWRLSRRAKLIAVIALAIAVLAVVAW